MSLDPRRLLRDLSFWQDWQDWQPGTENYHEVTEFLKAEITGLTGDDPSEEAFYATASPFAGYAFMAGLTAVSLIIAPANPVLASGLVWLLFGLAIAVRSGINFPLKRLGRKHISENICLTKKGGQRLIMVTASLAPDPAQFFARPGMPVTRILISLLETASWFLLAVSVSLAFLTSAALYSAWLFFALALTLLVMRHSDLLRQGVTPAASHLASAVCALCLMDRLISHRFADTEYRLVLTGGIADPGEGPHAYLSAHKGDFDHREVLHIHFDNIASETNCLVSEAGQWIRCSLRSSFLNSARQIINRQDISVPVIGYDQDDLSVMPFARRFKKSLIIAGISPQGERSPAGSMRNQFSSVSAERVEHAIDLAEQSLLHYLSENDTN